MSNEPTMAPEQEPAPEPVPAPPTPGKRNYWRVLAIVSLALIGGVLFCAGILGIVTVLALPFWAWLALMSDFG